VQDQGNLDPIVLTNAGTVNITTSGEIFSTAAGPVTITTTAGDIATGGQIDPFHFAVNLAALSPWRRSPGRESDVRTNGSAGSVGGPAQSC